MMRNHFAFAITALFQSCTCQAWLVGFFHGSHRHPMCPSGRPSHSTARTAAATSIEMPSDETEMKPSSETATSVESSTMAFDRAWTLAEMVFVNLALPIGLAAFKNGIPTSQDQWDEFWLLRMSDASKNATVTTLAEQFTLVLEEMGPTYVKFGQALGSRPDVVPRTMAQQLQGLQDQMQPFDNELARKIIRDELPAEQSEAILATMSKEPVAAASIGQVYAANLASGAKVAIKVQRPGIHSLVDADASFLLKVSRAIEGVAIGGKRLIQTDVTGAVEEFMLRIREELDYRNEAKNLELFASLYSHRRDMNKNTSSSIQVVVPKVYTDLSTDNLLIMEWIDGTKLVDLETEESRRESYHLILQGIDCTLSQLLETGVLHADPHGGNLLKVREPSPSHESTKFRLGYVDFGLLATVPETVRDGLVCAVAELIFERDVQAVANLFGELALIPDSILQDPAEMKALGEQLEAALDEVLIYPSDSLERTIGSTVPGLRFDRLLNVLSRLVPRFQFQLPPYFLNNARALSTLEGIAREIEPTFNVLQFLYPYALNRIVANPTNSKVVERTLQHLITDPRTGRVDPRKIRRLVNDMSLLTGFSKWKLLRDILSSPNGPKLIRKIIRDPILDGISGRRKTNSSTTKSRQRHLREATGFFRL